MYIQLGLKDEQDWKYFEKVEQARVKCSTKFSMNLLLARKAWVLGGRGRLELPAPVVCALNRRHLADIPK